MFTSFSVRELVLILVFIHGLRALLDQILDPISLIFYFLSTVYASFF